VNNTLVGQINALENGDMAPTPAMLAAYAAACKDLGTALATWKGITGAQLTAFNALLKQHNLGQLSAGGLTPGACPGH